MMQNWQETDEETLAVFEQQKAEAITAQTKQAIIAQIMQIKSRMPHQNIPQNILTIYTLSSMLMIMMRMLSSKNWQRRNSLPMPPPFSRP